MLGSAAPRRGSRGQAGDIRLRALFPPGQTVARLLGRAPHLHACRTKVGNNLHIGGRIVGADSEVRYSLSL